MRAAFENEAKQSNKARLLMSAAVSAAKDTIDSAYQIPKLGQYKHLKQYLWCVQSYPQQLVHS